MDMTGQEQNPAEVTVARNNRQRSNVWEHFDPFRTGDGKSKAKCKKCNRVLAAETRNGTSSLLRHVRTCKRLGGSETDGHESNRSSLGDHYDQTTLLFGYEMPAPSLSFPSDLPPTPQKQPPLLPPAPPLGDPPLPHGSSGRGASGLEKAYEGAARPPQPMSPPTMTLSLSLPGSSMHDQDEEIVQKVMSDFGQLSNMSIDKVQDMGAAPICSVEEAAAMSVGAAPPTTQQPPPCAPSRSGRADGGLLDSDHDPGMEEASEHLAPQACALSVSVEPGLEVDERAHHGPGLEEDEASRDLARMIALHGYDSSFVEDNHFRSFVRRLNHEFEVPSRVAIEEMCDGIFDEARRDLLYRLMRASGNVNVAVGRAKTMEEEILYVACHYIDDEWNLHKLLLHASVTTDHHHVDDGPILGLDVVRTHGIDDLVDLVISDHYIDNRLFMVASETTDKDIHPALKYNYPFAGPYIVLRYMDNVLHSIAQCLVPLDRKLDREVRWDIEKLLLTRQGRLELLADLDLHYGWAYEEHWYACYCCLKVLCKKGFPRERTQAEIVIINLLCKLWEKIYRAIQKISSSTRPTANLCLTELFKLRGILQAELERFSSADHGDDSDLFGDDKDVTSVLKEASDTTDKAIENSYLCWSLPLTLDPRYKLEFISFNFKRVYGLEAAKEYVSKVTTMITELYADYVEEYGTKDGEDDEDGACSSMDITTSADDPLEQAWNEHCRSQQGMTTQIISSCNPEAETELDRYLKDPLAPHHPQADGFNILNWWKAHSSEYPMVARMARDALAMPTCSKLSSDQMAQVRSILRGYSKKPYETLFFF